MIKGDFQFASENIEVVVDGNQLMFYQNGVITFIEGIKLDKKGVLKEFPDLENNEDWRKIAIERFKKHIKKYKTEMEKINYIKDELEKYGYTPLFYQKAGFRPQRFK